MRNENVSTCLDEMKLRGIEVDRSTIYILPEMEYPDYDLLNEFSPDLKNYLELNGCKCEIVSKEEHRFLALRDANIILPVLFGIPAAIISGLIVEWIKLKFNSDSKLRIEITQISRAGEYSNIKAEGSKSDIIDLLKNINEE